MGQDHPTQFQDRFSLRNTAVLQFMLKQKRRSIINTDFVEGDTPWM
jgi:hypothetical protein